MRSLSRSWKRLRAAVRTTGYRWASHTGRPLLRCSRASRIARTGLVAFAAASAAVGGLAFSGIDVSTATAPLLASPRAPGVLPDEATPPPVTAPRISAFAAPAPADPPPEPSGPDLSFLKEPPRTYTRAEIKLIASTAGWPDHLLEQVAEVAWCESSYNPHAVNGRIYGLMQVVPLWFSYGGHDLSRWSDPVVNMQAALTAYQYDIAKGYSPWTQWQCRPGGFRVPSSEFAPPTPDESPTPTAEASPTLSPSATPSTTPSITPTPTLAPWDYKPSWPPVEERQTPASGDAGERGVSPATLTPAPSSTPIPSSDTRETPPVPDTWATPEPSPVATDTTASSPDEPAAAGSTVTASP